MKHSILLFIAWIAICAATSCGKDDLDLPPSSLAKPHTDTTSIPDRQVKDSNGNTESFTDADSVTWPSLHGEVVFDSLRWISPWGYMLEIRNFLGKTPAGAPYKIFVKRSDSATWIEVPFYTDNLTSNGKYDYFVETRPDGAGMYYYKSLYVCYYAFDVSDRPAVMIKY